MALTDLMIIVAQSVLMFGTIFGLMLFIYSNIFIFKRLFAADKKMSAEEKVAEVATTTMPAVVNPVINQEMMFYMYQEQIRRYIDAKIDIMKASAETQNQILLMQAKATCEGTFAPIEQYQIAAREETKRYLDDIDNQIKEIPGPTKDQKDQWILAHLYEEA